MRRVIVTGFEPIAPATVDPSWEAAELLAQIWDGPGEVIARRLPAVFGDAPHRLRMSIAKHIPDAVIITAVAPGLPGLAIERLAINLDDATTPDAAGNLPTDRRIVEDAPAGLWSTLPDRRIVERLSAVGIPCGLSTSGGTHVPNHTFYQVQRELVNWGVASGLVRLPATPEMGLGEAYPTATVSELAQALRIVVLTTLADLGDDAAHVLLAQSAVGSAAAPGFDTAPESPGLEPEVEPEATPDAVPDSMPVPVALPSATAFDDDEDVATQPFLMPISEPIYRPELPTPVPELEPEDSPSFTQVIFPDRAAAAQVAPAPAPAPAPASAPAPEEETTAPLHVAPQVAPRLFAPEPSAPTQAPARPAWDTAPASAPEPQPAPAEAKPDPEPTEPSATTKPPTALTWDQIIGGHG